MSITIPLDDSVKTIALINLNNAPYTDCYLRGNW